MTKFKVGARVRHKHHPEFGIGTIRTVNAETTIITIEHQHLTHSGTCRWCDEAGIPKGFGYSTNFQYEGLYEFLSEPAPKVFVGSHVRHLEHPEYGNGRVRFLHPNGTSLAVEFDNATNLDHDCAGHTKVNHGRWTKASSLELVTQPFKVGDTVLVAVAASIGGFYCPSFNGKQGKVISISGSGNPDVRIDGIKYPQYVPIEDLTLVKVDPVEAVRKATPKVRSFQPGSQCDRIVKYLLAGNSITPIKARQLFGAERLAARILEIRQAGHKVVATIKTDLNGKVYGEYSLRNVGRVWAWSRSTLVMWFGTSRTTPR